MKMHNINLKTFYTYLTNTFVGYNFTLMDELSIIDIAIFKFIKNSELNEPNNIFIGTCKIPYKLCFNNDFYSINVLIKGAIKGEEL